LSFAFRQQDEKALRGIAMIKIYASVDEAVASFYYMYIRTKKVLASS
jgi:hypothetical protein